MDVFSPQALRTARKAATLSQKALAEAVGTSERLVQMWEAGAASPSADFLLRTVALLNVSAQQLLMPRETAEG